MRLTVRITSFYSPSTSALQHVHHLLPFDQTTLTTRWKIKGKEKFYVEYQEIPSTHKQPLWRNRDFLLLWGGQIISTLGSSISAFAMPLVMLALTASPAQAGILMAARQIPYLLLSLPAGVLIDRWERKNVMIRCELVRWLALASLPLAFWLGVLNVAQFYMVALIEGTANVFFTLAQISALPRVVPPAQVPRAYALDTSSEYVGTLLGPVLGALLIGLVPQIALGAMLTYLVDSFSYLISLLSLLGIRVSFQLERVPSEQRSLWRGIEIGLRFLWQHAILRILMLLTASVNFLTASLALAVIMLGRDVLRLDVVTIGLILGAGGIGGLIGAVIAPWLHAHMRLSWLILGSVWFWALATFVLFCAPWVWLLMLAEGLISALWPIYAVALVSYRLSQTPDELQGRVNGAFRFVSFGAEALGPAAGGLLLAALGPRPLLVVTAAGLALVALLAGMTRLRWMGHS
jgi:MFS family permease